MVSNFHYVDVGMFLWKSEWQLSKIMKELQDDCLDIEDQGYPADYFGINIWKHDGGLH